MTPFLDKSKVCSWIFTRIRWRIRVNFNRNLYKHTHTNIKYYGKINYAQHYQMHLGMNVCLFVACLFARFLCVYFVCIITNSMSKIKGECMEVDKCDAIRFSRNSFGFCLLHLCKVNFVARKYQTWLYFTLHSEMAVNAWRVLSERSSSWSKL